MTVFPHYSRQALSLKKQKTKKKTCNKQKTVQMGCNTMRTMNEPYNEEGRNTTK